MGRSRARPGLAGGLTLLILAGCSSNPPAGSGGASPEPSQHASALSEADVQGAIDHLASLGIEIRIRPSDAAPITAVTGEPSAVRLLRHQVRNLALERVGGGGTRGADLDEVTAAAGGGPVSALIAGWAASGTTPAATWAASLLDPSNGVFPTLALVAFVADVSDSGGVSSRPSNVLALSSGYCADVSAYLSGALADIVDANADPPPWLAGLI
nr:hypothetical protein [Chloroflexota bacterium]